MPTRFIVNFAIALGLTGAITARAVAESGGDAQTWAIHGQTTFVEQYHPAFKSPYRGVNSLDPGSRGNETWDATLYAGFSPWEGGELWINGEIDQGFGLSNSLGIAGFPNGEAYKIGSSNPYPKLPRLFFRQTVDFGGEVSKVDADINQLGGTQTKNQLVVTIGKFAAADVFDHNTYSDDSKHAFLNWALIDLGTFDYAANAWGYTYGAAAEWYQDRWAVRAGLFDLSDVPNSSKLESTFLRQFQLVLETEEDHTLLGQAGVVRVLGFLSHGRMGMFSDAIRLASLTGQPADVALVRHVHERAGFGVNIEQHLADDIGVFFRAGYDDPSREPYEFIDADRTASGGISLNGSSWGSANDTAAVALVVNGIASQHARYFNAGGLGILVGDGRLPRPGNEQIVEALYTLSGLGPVKFTLDYQFVENPAYNKDRGPVSVLGLRVHSEF